MDRRIVCLLLLVLTGVSPAAFAQDDDEGYRMELGAAAGCAFYRGDANSGFYRNTGAAGGIAARYLLNPRMALKGMLGIGGIKGATRGLQQFYPEDPGSGNVSPAALDYTFSGTVADFSVTFEYNFWGYSFFEGFEGYHRLTPYIQMGLGFTYGDKGNAFSGNLPIGAGIKYKLGRRWNVGIDWSYHFSFSDKLDGLSDPHGIRTSGLKHRDSYALTMVFVTYDLFPKCVICNKD